jgi:hypothetical protein
MLGKNGKLMSSQKINGEAKSETVTVGGKKIPIIQATSITTIKHKTTGVVYKDETEWKNLGIDPKDIQVDTKITIPSLDLLAKTK